MTAVMGTGTKLVYKSRSIILNYKVLTKFINQMIDC